MYNRSCSFWWNVLTSLLKFYIHYFQETYSFFWAKSPKTCAVGYCGVIICFCTWDFQTAINFQLKPYANLPFFAEGFPLWWECKKKPLPVRVHHLSAFVSIHPKVWMGKYQDHLVLESAARAYSTEKQTRSGRGFLFPSPASEREIQRKLCKAG